MIVVKRITANLPAELLESAMTITGRGITETLAAGLELLKRRSAYDKAMALKGRIHLDLDLASSRERADR